MLCFYVFRSIGDRGTAHAGHTQLPFDTRIPGYSGSKNPKMYVVLIAELVILCPGAKTN